MLRSYYYENEKIIEIGTDEVGRGPLFGRVYTASVILPKDNSFDHSRMKDSKRFHSKKKIKEVSDYIKQNSLAWSINYETESVIDELNVLQATQKSMHKSILKTRSNYISNVIQHENNCDNGDNDDDKKTFCLLVDGNYFKAITYINDSKTKLETIPHLCIKGGDNLYSSIAAASILAKVARDDYIKELCEKNEELVEFYNINSNKGYGSHKHIEGIKKHGITQWHRKTFGICKLYNNLHKSSKK